MKFRPIPLLFTAAGLCGFGLFVWPYITERFTGFSEYAATVEEDYAKIEAAGFPLDAKSFAASFAVPEFENNGQSLYDALAPLDGDLKRLYRDDPNRYEPGKYGLVDLVGKTRFLNPQKETPTDAEIEQAFNKVRPLIQRAVQASEQPYYVPNLDWGDPLSIERPDISGARIAIGTLSYEAVFFARTGQRDRALENFRHALKFHSLIADIPTLISVLVEYSGANIIGAAVGECARLDPKGAAQYRSVLDRILLTPIEKSLHSEVFNAAAVARNQSAEVIAGIRIGESTRSPKTPGEPVSLSSKDLPDHGAMRGLLGYCLHYWSDILAQVRPDGTVIDRNKYEEAMRRADKASLTEHRAAGLWFAILFRKIELDYPHAERAYDKIAVAYAATVVLEHKDRTGKWPVSLEDAGYSRIAPAHLANRNLGYRVDGDKAQVWSLRQRALRLKGNPKTDKIPQTEQIDLP